MRTRTKLWLPVILLLGFGIRLVVSFGFTPSQTFMATDGADYAAISKNLAEGRGYSASSYRWFEPSPAGAVGLHPDVYRPPLLPFLGAALYRLPVPASRRRGCSKW